MYLVIWKYKIIAADRRLFEREYGYAGAWAHFFRRSKQYIGSRLYRGESNQYLLMDAWENKDAYEKFLDDYRSEYDQLSDRYGYLYKTEERMGEFTEVQPEYGAGRG